MKATADSVGSDVSAAEQNEVKLFMNRYCAVQLVAEQNVTASSPVVTAGSVAAALSPGSARKLGDTLASPQTQKKEATKK